MIKYSVRERVGRECFRLVTIFINETVDNNRAIHVLGLDELSKMFFKKAKKICIISFIYLMGVLDTVTHTHTQVNNHLACKKLETMQTRTLF